MPLTTEAGGEAAAAMLTAAPGRRLAGVCAIPGDKSISHRALLLAAMCVGESRISGLLEGQDILRTAAALAALGVPVSRRDDATWTVHGVGVGGLAEPAAVLDFGNSGTGARLVMGLLASQPMTSFLAGDDSLCARPMQRVATPLEAMGARITARSGCRLPLAMVGAASPVPIAYVLPVPSAQVKSAVLLAGLNAPGETSVIEAAPSRDHTERMLRHIGADLRIAADADGRRRITIVGRPELPGCDLAVPGDPSSAAFPLVAALITPGSRVDVAGVAVNPLRGGLYETLREMGAEIEFSNRRDVGGEPVADLSAAFCALRGIEVAAARAPSMIDEYPILGVAAACAEGRTVMHGVAELRVKESDRLAAMAQGLAACGVTVEEGPDWLAIDGAGGAPPGGGRIAARLDHRIAMAFLVLGLAARAPVTVDGVAAIDTSFPGFVAAMAALGADIAAAEA